MRGKEGVNDEWDTDGSAGLYCQLHDQFCDVSHPGSCVL